MTLFLSGGPRRGCVRVPASKSAAQRLFLCAALGAEALGLLFLEGDAPEMRLTPLVYVPGSGTECWETSCASGSAAVAIALSAGCGAPVQLALTEPGGVLKVESDARRGETWLSGRTRFIGEEIV